MSRLQALDSTFDSIEERLEEAATLSGIINFKCIEKDIESGSLRKPRGHARAEWVLRWLVEKLQSDQSSGATFRSSHISWKLLLALMEIIPQSNTARLLKSGKILLTVRKTLDEWLETHSSKLNQANHTTAPSPETLPKRGVKRKWNTEQENGYLHHDSSEAEFREVYDYIMLFINQLIVKVETPRADTDIISQEHLKSVLRADSDLAAEILSSWMRICRVRIAHTSGSEDLSLNPFMKIWSARSVGSDAGDDDASSQLFSNNCIVPSTLLYGTILKTHFCQNDFLQDLKQELEELFSLHAFLPARAAYFSAKQRKSTAISLWSSTVVSLLSPIQEAISYCRTSSNEDQLDLLLSTISPLYELAIRNTRRSTPKQRHFEAPWLEAVLCALSSVGGAALSQNPTAQSNQAMTTHHDSSYPPLVNMIQISKRFNVSLSEELLRTIVSPFMALRASSSSSRGTISTGNWPLIMAVLDFDGSVFVGSNEQNSNVNPNLIGPELSRQLISHISRMSWDDTPMNRDNDSSSVGQSREQFISGVVIGFMNAYIRLRRLPEFIKMWNSELNKISSSITGPGEGHTVWTSELLIKEAERQWEGAMIPSQLKILLDQFTRPFDALGKELEATTNSINVAIDISELNSYSEASAASVIVDAILAAMNRDEVLSTAKDSMTRLFSSVRYLIDSKVQPSMIEARLFRILSRIIQRQMYCETAEDLLRNLKEVISSKAMDVAKQRVSSNEPFCSRLYETLVFMLTVSDLARRDVSLKTEIDFLTRTAAVAVEYQWRTRYNKDKFGATDLLDVGIRFPFLLWDLTNVELDEVFVSALSWEFDTAQKEQHEEIQLSSIFLDYNAKLEAFQESIILLASHRILWVWITSILGFFSQEITSVMEERLAQLLMRVPPKVLSKQEKTSIADKLVDYSINVRKGAFSQQFVVVLARMIRLAGKPKVSIDADTLFKLVLARPNRQDLSIHICQYFIDIVACVFETLDSDERASQRAEYLAGYDQLLSEMLRDGFQDLQESGCHLYIPLLIYRVSAVSNRRRNPVSLGCGLHEVLQKHLETFYTDMTLRETTADQPCTALFLDLVQDCFAEVGILDGSKDRLNQFLDHRPGLAPAVLGLSSHENIENDNRVSLVSFEKAVALANSYFETDSINVERKAKSLTLLRRWANSFIKQNPQWVETVFKNSKCERTSRGYLICRNLCIEELDRGYVNDEEQLSNVKAILPLLTKELQRPDSPEAHEIGYTITVILSILRSKVSAAQSTTVVLLK